MGADSGGGEGGLRATRAMFAQWDSLGVNTREALIPSSLPYTSTTELIILRKRRTYWRFADLA